MSSDPFDDDPFFAQIDLAELDACEAQAITATQARAKENTTTYHHAVNSPRPEAIKPPRPLNTEPRAGGQSTFGFGEGGKHAHPANATRYVENVHKRKEYWGLHRDDDKAEEMPNVTIDASGGYGLVEADDEDDDGQVIDLHAPGARARTMARRASPDRQPPPSSQAAMARRAAIARAAQDQSNAPPNDAQQHGAVRDNVRLPPTAGPSRSLSRSVSAGNQFFARAPLPAGLAPIVSQVSASQQQPASQGSQIRRSVFELDSERQRREKLEEQVRRLTGDLDRLKKTRPKHWADGLAPDPSDEGTASRLQELQTELWKAKGEASTIRRAQQEESNRHRINTEKLQKRIADMERSTAEKERESVARMESVKSQAIFATHAAFNSTGKGKAKGSAAPRPVTPTRSQNGSPRDRAQRAKTPRPMDQQSPTRRAPPRFGGLHNAFTAGSKVKPVSPVKKDLPAGPSECKMVDADGILNVDRLAPHDQPATPHDQAAEAELMDYGRMGRTSLQILVHHTLNYVAPQLLKDQERRPAVQRLLQYRPHVNSQTYLDCCSDLLRACSESQDAIAEADVAITRASGRLFAILVQSPHTRLEGEESLVFTDVLALISSSIFLCPLAMDPVVCQGLVASSRQFVRKCLQPDQQDVDTLRRRGTRAQPRDARIRQPSSTIVHYLVRLCEGLCWLPDPKIWTGDHLAYIIHTLADPGQSPVTVRRAIALFRAASCNPGLFRAVIASTTTMEHGKISRPVSLPVLERMSRYLATPHPRWDPTGALGCQASIIRSLSMLTCADDDAIILLAEQSALIPSLIQLLYRQAAQMLGMSYRTTMSQSALSVVVSSLYLLHHLVFPAPVATHSGSRLPIPLSQRPFVEQEVNNAVQAPQGIDLRARLLAATAIKEWSALTHMFVSALGNLSYCELVVARTPQEADRLDWRTVQYLAQDLLESVVEGPEADEIYEVYSNGSVSTRREEAMEVDGGADEDEYAALRDVIVID